jgi:hypothetical protein
MPPMAEPEKLRRPMIRLNAETPTGFAGAPTSVRLPSTPSKLGGNAQDEVFLDHDAFGVAAVGHASEVLVRRIKRENHVRAELLEARFASGAGAV